MKTQQFKSDRLFLQNRTIAISQCILGSDIKSLQVFLFLHFQFKDEGNRKNMADVKLCMNMKTDEKRLKGCDFGVVTFVLIVA